MILIKVHIIIIFYDITTDYIIIYNIIILFYIICDIMLIVNIATKQCLHVKQGDFLSMLTAIFSLINSKFIQISDNMCCTT